ncbi:pentatricopeptide repeat-containing protein At2g20540-like [Wolffia australiana]
MVTAEQLISLVQNSRKRGHLLQLAAQAIARGLQSCPLLAPTIVSAFFGHGRPDDARRWFDGVPRPPTLLWNLLFKGHTQLDAHLHTLALFARMRASGAPPDRYSFTFVLKSCAKLPAATAATAVHALAAKTGFQSSRFVGTLLIDAYSPDRAAALKLFDEMPSKNAVAWTAIVAVHLAAGDLIAARSLLERAEAKGEADVVLCNTVLCGYIARGDMGSAREVFDRMPERDTMAWNTLLQGYAIAGELGDCERVFEAMPERNVFSWNGLIRGYLRHGRVWEALKAFKGLAGPNEASLAMAMAACGRTGGLGLARRLHLLAEARGFMAATHVSNAAVDMYAKCGDLGAALRVFRRAPRRDVVSWNAAIDALAAHGGAAAALAMLEEMKEEGVPPDGITYVGALSACVHRGWVRRGLALLKAMVQETNLSPGMAHYGCVVDLLARAGLVREAVAVVEAMPVEPDCVIWTTLLARGPVELARAAARRVARARPGDAANWVALSKACGLAKHWDDFAAARKMVKKTVKSPGRSSVEVNGRVFQFCSADSSLPQTEEIYRALAHLRLLCSSPDS